MKSHLITASLCLLTIICQSTVVFADYSRQDDFFSMSPAQLAEISVTIASQSPKTINQSAAVTSVITAEQIKAMGATELHEILETVPGMHVGTQTGNGDYYYSSRGINNGDNSQILLMMNGTRITTPYRGSLMTGFQLPVDAIQRLEIIRGPGSALYGADAFAGVVNIITKKAGDMAGGKLGVRAGNWDSQSAWAQQGGQWSGWDVAGSVQYQHSNGDTGQVVISDAQSAFDQKYGDHSSLAPGALANRNQTINAHVNMQRKHWQLGFWGIGGEGGTKAGLAGALDPTGVIQNQQFLGDVRFSSEDSFQAWEWLAHFSYLYSHVDTKAQLFQPNSSLLVDGNGDLISRLDFIPGKSLFFSAGAINHSGQTDQIPSFELSSIYRGMDQHEMLFNTAVRVEETTVTELKNYGDGVSSSGDLVDVTGTPYVYLPNVSRTVTSLALQDEWKLAEHWQLTSGVRYDHYSDFGSTVNPRLALVWDISTQLTTKMLYGRAFRAPNFIEQYLHHNPIVIGNDQLQPETINTVEWAFDYRPNTTLRTAVNIYYYQIDNLIAVDTDASKTFKYENSGSQDAYGTEFEWNWELSESVNLAGNYAWQHARNNLNGSRIGGVPEHHIYTSLQWHFLPKWHIQPQVNWVGSRIDTYIPSRTLPDYETVDFTLQGKKLFGRLNVAASLKNAFDSQRLELAPLQHALNLPLPGRSFYFEASVDF
ncbi:hypothetical protein JCM14076_16730 [Methylosoma difficile]